MDCLGEEKRGLRHFAASVISGILFAAGWWVLIDGYNYGVNVVGDGQSKATSGYAWVPPFFATVTCASARRATTRRRAPPARDATRCGAPHEPTRDSTRDDASRDDTTTRRATPSPHRPPPAPTADIMMNTMHWSELSEQTGYGADASTATKARLFLFFSLLICFAAIVGAAFLYANQFTAVAGSYQWAGASVVASTLMITGAAFLQRFTTLPPSSN
jgi:hypothetical protein